MASTLSYYFACPVPFTNLGYHLSNLLPPVSLSEQVERGIDNTEQVIRFFFIHRPSLTLNTTHYSKLTRRWNKECSLGESNHCVELAKDLENSSVTLINTIQSNLDNTAIHYGYCLLALILLTLPFVHFAFSIQSPFSLLVLVLYLISFTSYSLIIQPGFHPFIIACIAFLPSIRHSPKNTSLIILSLLISLIHPSPSLTTVSTWILLLAPLFQSSSFLSPLQVIMQVIYYFNPSLTLPAIIACFCCLFQPSSLPSLMLLFIHSQYSYSLLCLMITAVFIRKHSIHSLSDSVGVLSIALHYTYSTTSSFLFSSLHWSAAFVLTHSTHVVIQAGSMILSVFYPFCLLMPLIPKQYRTLILMLQVWVASISTLYNTASPVIWSVFTPLLLFMIVLWSLSLLFCFVLLVFNDRSFTLLKTQTPHSRGSYSLHTKTPWILQVFQVIILTRNGSS